MFQIVVALAMGAHGIGHSVGFWVDSPRWFQVAWLLPGAGFILGTVLLWQHDSRALPVLAASAVLSLALEIAAPGLLKPGPYANAFAFNVILLLAIAVPVTREWLVRL